VLAKNGGPRRVQELVGRQECALGRQPCGGGAPRCTARAGARCEACPVCGVFSGVRAASWLK
jgi:hypothetical protein